jgi:hypothetical protein
MIGWVDLAGLQIPVFRRTWIRVPPSVRPEAVLACAQGTLFMPALEPLPVEDLVLWAVVRGLCQYTCRDEELQSLLLRVLHRDYETPPAGVLRALPGCAGSLLPGPAEAALEAYLGAAQLGADEVLVAPEPGAQIEMALTTAPLRKSGHLCVVHYRPPMHPTAWLEIPFTADVSAICAAFGDSEAFESVYAHYDAKGVLDG